MATKVNGLTGLTEKQLRFIDAYVEHMEPTSAALIAELCDDYSTAHKLAMETLRVPGVAREVERRLIERGREASVSQAHVVRELARVAFFDMSQLFDEKGQMKPINELDHDTRRSLMHFDVIQPVFGSNGDVKIRFTPSSKMKALELLGKALGMFIDTKKVSVDGNGGFTLNMIPPPEKGKKGG